MTWYPLPRLRLPGPLRRLVLRVVHGMLGHPLDAQRTINYTSGELHCECGAIVPEKDWI